MPDVIDDDDSDALAAEFVLGTLDADERTHANLLLDIDDSFRGKVRVWERRLGELHLMVEPVEPAPQIWERIKAKMDGGSPLPATAAPELKAAKAAFSAVTSEPKTEAKAEPISAAEPAEQLAASESAPEQQATEGADLKEDAETKDRAETKDGTDGKERLDATLDEIEAELRKVGVASQGPTPVAKGPLDLFPDHIAGEPQGERLADDVVVRQKDTIARDRGERDRPRSSLVRETGTADLRPALRRWRAVAVMMMALIIAVGGLLATWRYAPERLPAPLRATSLLHINMPALPPQKPKAPPESVFDE